MPTLSTYGKNLLNALFLVTEKMTFDCKGFHFIWGDGEDSFHDFYDEGEYNSEDFNTSVELIIEAPGNKFESNSSYITSKQPPVPENAIRISAKQKDNEPVIKYFSLPDEGVPNLDIRLREMIQLVLEEAIKELKNS